MRVTRGEFIARMKAENIGVGIHYPAMHLFTLFRDKGYAEGRFPVAEDIGARTVTLPLFPGMRDEDVLRVCQTFSAVLRAVLH